MNAGKLFLGVLVGVAVGGTLGILFAPNKGSKTRKKIIRKKDKYIDDLQEKFDELIGNIIEKMENIKGEAHQLVNDGMREVENLEADVVNTLKDKMKK